MAVAIAGQLVDENIAPRWSSASHTIQPPDDECAAKFFLRVDSGTGVHCPRRMHAQWRRPEAGTLKVYRVCRSAWHRSNLLVIPVRYRAARSPIPRGRA